LKRKCGGREILDSEDFMALITALEEHLEESARAAFDRCSNSGLLDPMVVPNLLSELFVPFMPGAKEKLSLDLCDLGDELSYSSFIRIYVESIQFAGLTRAEFEHHSQVFMNLAEDNLIPMQTLRAKLHINENFTKLLGGQAVLLLLAKESVKRSQTGTLDLNLDDWIETVTGKKEKSDAEPSSPTQDARAASREPRPTTATIPGCVLAIRVFHELLAINLKKLMSRLGVKTDVIEVAQIEELLEKMGFVTVIPETVASFIRALGLGNADYLNFDQMYNLVYRYGVSHGFTDEEEKEIVSIFNRLDEDASGTLEVAEIGPVLRCLGYHPTQFRLYNFVEEIGLEEDAELNIDQFRELIAKYGKINISAVRAELLAGEGLVEKLDKLMIAVGHDVTEEDMEWLLELAGRSKGHLSFSEFKTIERAFRANICEIMARNQGCTDAETKRYEHYFQENDPSGDGFITQKALRKLLGNLFPDTGLNKERHLRIAQLVKAADEDGNGMFDFDEFRNLLQRVTEEMDRDKLVQALRLRKELAFSAEEVRQWRDMYAEADDDGSGAIEFNELKSLLSSLVEMDGQATRELKTMFAKVDDGDGQMDFWEFLRFMKQQILDSNWRNINGIVGGMAGRAAILIE